MAELPDDSMVANLGVPLFYLQNYRWFFRIIFRVLPIKRRKMLTASCTVCQCCGFGFIGSESESSISSETGFGYGSGYNPDPGF